MSKSKLQKLCVELGGKLNSKGYFAPYMYGWTYTKGSEIIWIAETISESIEKLEDEICLRFIHRRADELAKSNKAGHAHPRSYLLSGLSLEDYEVYIRDNFAETCRVVREVEPVTGREVRIY